MASGRTAQIVVANNEFKQFIVSAQLEEQTAKLKDPSEWEEYEVLSRLIHVNRAQHRRGDYFCRLQAVARCACLLNRVAAARHIRSLSDIVGCPIESNDVGPHCMKLVVPSREQAVESLGKLHSSAELCARLVQLSVAACELLFSQMTISLYNILLPLSATFPLHERGAAAIGQHLPESLGVIWSHGIPSLLVHSFTDKDGFQQLVETSSSQYGLRHCTQATALPATGPSRRVEHVMAARATVADNVSLPVYASTRPQMDTDAATVMFNLPKMKCFQRPPAERKQPQDTGHAEAHTALQPQLNESTCAPDRRDTLQSSPEDQDLHKVQRSRTAKPPVADWKAVLSKQRRGRQNSGPVSVPVLQDSRLEGQGNSGGEALGATPEGHRQQARMKKKAKKQEIGAKNDFMDLLMHGSGKS